MKWKDEKDRWYPSLIDFMRENHTFQLYRGMGPSASAVGMPRVMSGATAHRLNQRFVLHHIASTDKDARLWNWKQIDAKVASHRITNPLQALGH